MLKNATNLQKLATCALGNLWWTRYDNEQVVGMLRDTSFKIHHSQFWRYKQYGLHESIPEKGRDLTQSYDKSPYTDRTIQKATWQHKNATKNFDYTSIVDRFGTVS